MKAFRILHLRTAVGLALKGPHISLVLQLPDVAS